jgi:predicted O-methyltransferase YrrM
MEKYAKTHDVPIAQPETMRFLEVLIKASGVEKVLEVGSAIGYSAIAMAKCGAHVTTIERDDKMLTQLYANLKKYGFEDKVTVVAGDALDVLKELTGEFDMVFLDAAKGHYMNFLPHCMRLIKTGGILVSDNILYKGMVATDELAIRRKVTIIRRMREYLTHICNHSGLITSIVPIGDGCAISYKIK